MSRRIVNRYKRLFVHTQLSILFLWQSKFVDPIARFLPSFRCIYIRQLYIIGLVLVLNIAEIQLAGYYTIIIQSDH